LLRSLARKISYLGSPQTCWSALRFRGIRIARNARLDIGGTFVYGRDCSIGVGSNVVIPRDATLSLGKGCYVGRHVEIGPDNEIQIGDQTSIQDRSILLGDITIGRYCLLAPNVYVSSGNHQFEIEPWLLIRDQDRIALRGRRKDVDSGKILIEDDCWLGINAVLRPGIIVGKGSVIGANSVVTSNVEPYTVVAGAPARRIKVRLNFQPPSQITYNNNEHLPYFYTGFAVSEAERELSARYRGLATSGSFVLALDPTQGRKISLLLRNVFGDGVAVAYGDQRLSVTDSFQEVAFEITAASRETKRFKFHVEPNGARLILAQAWVR
jgi:acetyltransferase-like isoleucine patch superfamily enzyme